tara:strand:- start:587 stop:979 length:393 start_codon:yes stop_codon:yes gene_type:complete
MDAVLKIEPKSNVEIIVTCDKCNHKEEVGHLSWHKIVCLNCKHEIENNHELMAHSELHDIYTVKCPRCSQKMAVDDNFDSCAGIQCTGCKQNIEREMFQEYRDTSGITNINILSDADTFYITYERNSIPW